MLFFCEPMPYACIDEPRWAHTRRSRCSHCSLPDFVFLLPLLFLASPLLSVLVALASHLFFSLAPIVVCMIVFTMASDCSTLAWPDYTPTNGHKQSCGFLCAATKEKKTPATTGEGKKGASIGIEMSESSASTPYEIHVPAAGVRPQDVQATLDHTNVLRVFGESAPFGKSIATIDRSIRLPPDADLNLISLSVSDGLVRITAEKKQPRVLRVLPASELAASGVSPCVTVESAGSSEAQVNDASAAPLVSEVHRVIPVDGPDATLKQWSGEQEDAGFVEVSSREGKKEQ